MLVDTSARCRRAPRPTRSARLLGALLLALPMALLPALGRAQAQPAPAAAPNLAKACGVDLARHCSTVVPGGGRMMLCLEQHRASLDPTCQAALPAAAACAREAQSLCGATQGREFQRCLQTQRERFSEACRQMAPR